MSSSLRDSLTGAPPVQVLHCNLNEQGIWPGPEHGAPAAVGSKAGVGANLNFPMPTSEGDAAYCYTFNKFIFPDLAAFDPVRPPQAALAKAALANVMAHVTVHVTAQELVFVACGLDAMAGDPYATMAVTPGWYGWLAAELASGAWRYAGAASTASTLPVVFNLEGGYNARKCSVAVGKVVSSASLQSLRVV